MAGGARRAPPAVLSRTRWSAVVFGAAAGLGATAVIALVLFVAGLRPSTDAEGAAFIFTQFLGQLLAGTVAGRLAPPQEIYHGSQAGLMLFGVTTALTLAAGGSPSVATIFFGAVVALVIGAAGGVLGMMTRPPESADR